MSKSFNLHSGRGGAALAVHVIPRAQRNEIIEISSDGSIKIRLKSSTDRDEVNTSLIAFLARVLQVRPSSLEVVAGQSSLSKLVSVLDLDAGVVHQRVLKNLS